MTVPRSLLPALFQAALAVLVTPASYAHAQNWPSFRGPEASGVASGTPPVSWDVARSTNVAWKTTIPGLAHSSPIVWGDLIYVTTSVAESGKAALVTGDAGINSAQDVVRHTWHLLAIDKASGRVAWDRTMHSGVPRVKRHVKSSHASATPATDGRAIVALLDSEGLFCFAAGRIYLSSEDGDVFVVRAGRRFELLSTNRMGEIVMATPAISGTLLIVRTQTQLVGLKQS